MKSSTLACALVALGLASSMGCSGAGDAGSSFARGGGGSSGSSGGEGGSGGTGIIGGEGGSGGGGQNIDPPCSASDPNADQDGDGFTPAQGDCNDCSAAMNPGAYDFAADGVDEDCNGTKDDEPTGCDTGLPMAGDAVAAANSIGICRMQQGASWGLVSAKWVFPDGTVGGGPNQQSHGILPRFGTAVKPRDGGSLLAISSGVAREGINGESPAGADMGTMSQAPLGFPKDSPSCPGVQTSFDTVANDGVGLELVIKTPTNAHSLGFDFDFYTFEFPMYVCSEFNDFFVAILSSQHPLDPKWSGNISFDSQGNPVSVNNGLVQVCQGPTTAGGKPFACPLGPGELVGTGFDQPGFFGPQSAATSWLHTTAGIVPGETITLRFAIWDMGDHVLDSTALIDNFGWDVEQGDEPVTVPVPH